MMSNIGPTGKGIMDKIEELQLWPEVIALVRLTCLERGVSLPDGVPCVVEECIHKDPCPGCGRSKGISR